MAAQLTVFPLEQPLVGSIPLPGDQELTVARIALASHSRGKSTLRMSCEQRSTATYLEFLRRVGITAEHSNEQCVIQGRGIDGFSAPEQVLDLRGDAMVAALAIGSLVSRPFASELIVDDVVGELLLPALAEAHGVTERAEPSGGRRVRLEALQGNSRAGGLSVVLHGVYPWIKQAILIAGLRASGPTTVQERLATADHLERAMTRARMPLDAQGTVLALHPPRDEDAIAPQICDGVGSLTMAGALLAATGMKPGGSVTLREVGTNPTRADVLTALKMMGAHVAVAPLGDRQGEPLGNVSMTSTDVRPIDISGEMALRLRDSLVPLLALSARAKGSSRFGDLVAERRGGDPKIWGRAAGFLASAGLSVESSEGVLLVRGQPDEPLVPLRVTTGGDSRLAVLATLLALGAYGKSVIDDVDCLAPDFPRWFGSLRALGARVEIKRE